MNAPTNTSVGYLKSRVQAASVLIALITVMVDFAPAQENAAEKSARARGIEIVQRYATQHRISPASEPNAPFELHPHPLINWTNPTRGNVFGGVFLWVREGRPMVCGGVFVWHQKSGIELTREFHSLTSEPITAKFGGERIWEPNVPGIKFQPVPGSKPPGDSRVVRRRQMKGLASRFSTSISYRNVEPKALRLLPTPIYRYEVPEAGVIDGAVIDGAIFAFVQATDPEALLLVEARSVGDSVQWHYAFARCTAWAVTARLEETVVYEAPIYDFTNTKQTAPFFNIGRTMVDLNQ